MKHCQTPRLELTPKDQAEHTENFGWPRTGSDANFNGRSEADDDQPASAAKKLPSTGVPQQHQGEGLTRAAASIDAASGTEGATESAPGGLSVETPADTSSVAAALCDLSGRVLPEDMQGQGALSTSSTTRAPNHRASNAHQSARVHLRNLPSALRNSFYHTEEDLKRCEHVKSTTKIPRISTRVWVKYTDGMWAATVTEVNAPRTSFVVKFEYNNSTETIVAKGRDRVHVYFEDLGQLSHTQRSSRFRGVSWKRDSSRWQVQITDRKNKRYLGTFRLEEEEAAALAYDREARRLGRTELNFPDRAPGPTAAVSDTSNRETTQAFEHVQWSDIIPFRGYARDSGEASGRAAELVQLNSHMKTRDDLIFARRTPKWEGLVSRQQIYSMAQHPERIT